MNPQPYISEFPQRGSEKKIGDSPAIDFPAGGSPQIRPGEISQPGIHSLAITNFSSEDPRKKLAIAQQWIFRLETHPGRILGGPPCRALRPILRALPGGTVRVRPWCRQSKETEGKEGELKDGRPTVDRGYKK